MYGFIPLILKQIPLELNVKSGIRLLIGKFVFIGLLGLNLLSAQEIKYDDLLNTKWLLSNYIIGSRELPIEKKRKKDYYIFKENNQKEERLFGEKVSGTWEYLPHGKFIMFYSDDKEIYVPARIRLLTPTTLHLSIFDINSMRLITLVYRSK